jgi:hypothetical protein
MPYKDQKERQRVAREGMRKIRAKRKQEQEVKE